MGSLKDRRVAKTPRKTLVKTKRVIEYLKYEGKDVAIVTEVQGHMTEWDTRNKLREMPLYRKIHMKEQDPAMYKISKAYGISQKEYLTANDLGICVTQEGYKNIAQVKANDPRLAVIIKKRGLEYELFQDPSLQELSL